MKPNTHFPALLLFLLLSQILNATSIKDTIFYDDFGQHISRASCPYMPGGSFKFADPALSSDAKEIQDGYYALVAPSHIADPGPASYFWPSSSSTSYTPSGAKPYTNDHTGNSNGAVMVINAGNTVNYLYKRSVTVPVKTMYRFSCWIYVVSKSSQITLEARNTNTGTVVATYTTPVIAQEATWLYYSVDIPIPRTGTDSQAGLTVGIKNESDVVQGNDYLIDDVLLTSLALDPLTLKIAGSSSVCIGSDIGFYPSVAGGASVYSYSWSGPDGFSSSADALAKNNVTMADAGIYRLLVTDAIGNTVSDSASVTVNSNPASAFTVSTTSIDNKNSAVTGSITPATGVSYAWDLGDGTTETGASFLHTYTVTGASGEFIVTLKATNSSGCQSETSQSIETTPFVPNVFTPNGDGINDVFMAGFETSVYDRNGLLVYTGTKGWDGTFKGKNADSDTYYYIIHYLDFNKNLRTKKGYIALQR
jgi:gliding motility-associated-like protein